jgi:hypothetical protein
MDLSEFLVRAKVSSYASGGERSERKLEDGGKEFVHEEGGFRYRDRYFGSDPFAGEEVVWRDGKAVWVMNYRGQTTTPNPPAEKIYAFLRSAMRRVAPERPFRGPAVCAEGDFEYRDRSEGTVEHFIGEERILHQGKEIYRLRYHGGFVRDK